MPGAGGAASTAALVLSALAATAAAQAGGSLSQDLGFGQFNYNAGNAAALPGPTIYPGSGLSKGAVAGIIIACVLGGIFIGSLAMLYGPAKHPNEAAPVHPIDCLRTGTKLDNMSKAELTSIKSFSAHGAAPGSAPVVRAAAASVRAAAAMARDGSGSSAPSLLPPVDEAAAAVVAGLGPWRAPWGVAVELAVHVQARAFGFQAFNASQEVGQAGEVVPATSGAAGDHLVQLLRDRAAVVAQGAGGGSADDVFAGAVGSLHAAVFAPYAAWRHKAGVAAVDRELSRTRRGHRGGGGTGGGTGGGGGGGGAGGGEQPLLVTACPGWVGELGELALYFCLWSEAANLRHTPELLWLLFHLMRASANHAAACTLLGDPGCALSPLAWAGGGGGGGLGPDAAAAVLARGFVRGALLPARNARGSAFIRGALLDCSWSYSPDVWTTGRPGGQAQGGGAGVTSLAAQQCAGLQRLHVQGRGVRDLAALLDDELSFFGDGCVALDMAVQPAFNLLAEQVGLMGEAGEQPALRLGYDDANESACIPAVRRARARVAPCGRPAGQRAQRGGAAAGRAPTARRAAPQVLLDLVRALAGDARAARRGGGAAQDAGEVAGADPWDRLLLLFERKVCAAHARRRPGTRGRTARANEPAAAAAAAASPQAAESAAFVASYASPSPGGGLAHRALAFRPATQAARGRYPRSYRRLDLLAGQLRAATLPGCGGAPDGVAGSAPVSHLGASLRVTDELWAGGRLGKTFVETRSLGAVAVAFSRLLTLHAVLLVWWSLMAYLIPDVCLDGSGERLPACSGFLPELFGRRFWAAHGMTVALCASWALLAHAALHVAKDLTILHLVTPPSAVRVQAPAPETGGDLAGGGAPAKAARGPASRAAAWWARQWETRRQREGSLVRVSPPVHGGAALAAHNCVTLLFWFGCVWVLLDSHLPSWPLHRALGGRTPALPGGGRVPLWALASAAYGAAWALHQLAKRCAEALPPRAQGWLGFLSHKEARRSAEHFFPYSALSGSHDLPRYAAACGLWGVVLCLKFLFDFLVVLRPLAQGPARALLSRLSPPLDSGLPPASGWAWVDAVLLVWSMWVAAAFLVFYDTGLIFQLVGALYSTAVLGLHRRVGHVKGVGDLVWAFPGLSRKLAQRLLPASAHVPAEAAAAAAVSRRASSVGGAGAGAGGGARAAAPPLLDCVPRCPPSEVLFAAAWDSVVGDLRARDHLSHDEAARLRYETLAHGAAPAQGAWLLPPRHGARAAAPPPPRRAAPGPRGAGLTRHGRVLRPARRFVVAGAAVEVAAAGISSLTQEEAVCRAFNLLAWLLASLGLLQEDELAQLMLVPTDEARRLAAECGGAPPRVASSRTVEAAAAALVDCRDLLQRLHAKLAAAAGGDDAGPAPAIDLSDIDSQLLLEQAFKSVAAVAGGGAAKALGEAAAGAAARAARGPTRGAPRRRCRSSPEAARVLCFFASSLHNPLLPTAPPVALMRSMTTLTPHYGEDVLYALDEPTALADMGAPRLRPGDPCSLFTPAGERTETLKYLQATYVAEWKNFAQRVITRPDVRATLGPACPAKPGDVTPEHFAPGGVLHGWREELLVWASMRGQLLERTVHGIMHYHSALQQLVLMQRKAELTAAAAALAGAAGGGGDSVAVDARERSAWLEAVVQRAAQLLARQKFSYVVSSQALGEFQNDGGVPRRWLSHCVRAVLARRYAAALALAYIDTENLSAPPPGAVAVQAGGGAVNAGPRLRTKAGAGPQLLRQYSVLLRWSESAGGVAEQYRIRLPMNLETNGGVILGEGKPENQNHALPFCHGEALQTIDCNQDSYLAEALKLPNLLAEFDGPGGAAAGVRSAPRDAPPRRWRCGGGAGRGARLGPALVGFREWVFSEDSGALAEFAAATERSFGTTVQRLMHNPGGCRFHYGHPDVWDKLFVMTSGGVSKATKGLHVSEDVFGGYGLMLRGRGVAYVDYIAVGKGRDMGFESINTFEAKARPRESARCAAARPGPRRAPCAPPPVPRRHARPPPPRPRNPLQIAGGNGEQVISRDVQRLARRFSMPRLLTWYHTALLMYSLLVNAWLVLLLALFASSRRAAAPAGGSAAVVDDLLTLVGGLQLLQLGSLSLLTYVATVWLEDGLLATLKNVLRQLVSGSLLFYVFRGQTTAHAFASDVAYGGAKYSATGRGYKLAATPFVDLFQAYARSHMWFGAHLLLLLVVAGALGLPMGFAAVWSYVLVVLGLLMAPAWFNPFGFSWDRNKARRAAAGRGAAPRGRSAARSPPRRALTCARRRGGGAQEAGREFVAWLRGHQPAGAGRLLWRQWNEAQLAQAADDAGVQLGRALGALSGALYLLPSAVILCYAVEGMLDTWWKSVLLVCMLNAAALLLWAFWAQATRLEAVRGHAVMSRLIKFGAKLAGGAGLVVLVVFLAIQGRRHHKDQRWLGPLVVRLFYVEFELARLVGRLLLAFLPRWQPARRLVNVLCWLADAALGLLLLLLLFVGSLFGLLTRYQAAVLFSMGYAASWLAERALEGSEVGRLAKELQEVQRKQRCARARARRGRTAGQALPLRSARAAAPQGSRAPPRRAGRLLSRGTVAGTPAGGSPPPPPPPPALAPAGGGGGGDRALLSPVPAPPPSPPPAGRAATPPAAAPAGSGTAGRGTPEPGGGGVPAAERSFIAEFLAQQRWLQHGAEGDDGGGAGAWAAPPDAEEAAEAEAEADAAGRSRRGSRSSPGGGGGGGGGGAAAAAAARSRSRRRTARGARRRRRRAAAGRASSAGWDRLCGSVAALCCPLGARR
ncbi:CALS3 [Scenedesmus sp. PABB004]|nr:CALS3 [Scenedesmus sp. PABB004]